MEQNIKIMKSKGRFVKTAPGLTCYSDKAVLAVWFLLLVSFPAFYSCSKKDVPPPYSSTGTEPAESAACRISVKAADGSKVSSLDIFFFNDDRLRKLDSWQHVETDGADFIDAASRQGRKILFILANARLSEDTCRGIRSYDDLGSLYSDIKDDLPDAPVMSGESRVSAGNESNCCIPLSPLMSEVVLNSISCDFHGHPYAGEMLRDVKIYLTNICGRYPFTGDAASVPECILNHGKLSDDDVAGFKGGCLIYCGTTDIGESVLFPEIHLYCYPNTATEEGLGTPFTRLVIEGSIAGKKTFYPINVNRGAWQSGNVPGITRNSSYIYDITLTRTGVNDPETAIETGNLMCSFEVSPWKSMDRRVITY